jgi:hypothetical protein
VVELHLPLGVDVHQLPGKLVDRHRGQHSLERRIDSQLGESKW